MVASTAPHQGSGAALFSRPRKNTRRYLDVGPGISWGSSDPLDELVRSSFSGCLRHRLCERRCSHRRAQATTGTMGRTLSDHGAAQSRLQGLDDDFYVRVRR